MFIYKLISMMLIFISLGIYFATMFQFFQYFKQSVESLENVLLKFRKETNFICFSYIIGYVCLNKNNSDL